MRGLALPRSIERVARRALGIALILLLLGLAAYLALWWRVSAAVDRILAQVPGVASVQRGTSFVGLDGHFGVDSLRLVPRIGAARIAPLRTGVVTVRGPGTFWMVDLALRGQYELPESLTIEFEQFAFEGEPSPTATAMPIGVSTGSPFEAFGCGDPGFSLTDIEAIGLRNVAPRASLRIERETNSRLALEFATGADDVGRTTITAYLALPAGADPIAALGSASLVSARLEVSDDGFVRARNRYCAARAGISQFEFIARHVALVRTWVGQFDLVPANSVEASYRRFATRGRGLSIDLRPTRPVMIGALLALSGPKRWEQLGATIKTTGEPAGALAWEVPLPEFEFVGPPELPAPTDASAIASTPLPPAIPAAGSAAADPAPTSNTTAPAIATREPAGASAPVAAAPAPVSVAPSPISSAHAVADPPRPTVRSLPPAAPVSQPQVSKPVPAPAREVALARPAPASGLPPLDPAPTALPAPPAAAPALQSPASFDDLANYVGRVITVRSIYGTTRSGVLTKFTRAGITLRVSSSGGGFELSMPSRTIRTVSIGESAIRGPGYRG
jgi:hypothetical protein